MDRQHFEQETYADEIRALTDDRLEHLILQLGRNGETQTSQPRRAVIEEELSARRRRDGN